MLIFDMHARRKYPLGYMRCRLTLLRRLSEKSFKEANATIFISEYAKEIVDDMVPDRKGLSVVIPHGLDDVFRTATREEVQHGKSLPQRDYLLYVSVIDVFKAQIEVVQAYHLLCQKRETKEKLLLVGPEYVPYAKLLRREIRRLRLDNKVIIAGNIPYSDMPSVYHHAKAHIFASTCENCPNVLLESLGSGRPLFLSNREPIPEFAGDCAVYFNPDKPHELSDLLFRYLDDKQWMKEMGRKAFERSLLYNWEETAKKTFQTFEDLLKKVR
jgi:glycosyltransferase involved in cell wall biosynthesis